MTDFGKLLTASITPFDSNGVINTDTFWRLCRKLVHDKSDGLVLTGTTGESPNLTIKDREIIYTTALDSVGEKASIVAGTGTYSTSETIECDFPIIRLNKVDLPTLGRPIIAIIFLFIIIA